MKRIRLNSTCPHNWQIAIDLDNDTEIDASFLDFSKVFDQVPHKRLLLKLSHYDIPKQLPDWIKDFPEERIQSVASYWQLQQQLL